MKATSAPALPIEHPSPSELDGGHGSSDAHDGVASELAAGHKSHDAQTRPARGEEPFDLKTFVREGVEESTEADPHVIAKRLAPRIPDEHLAAVVATLLLSRVSYEIRQQRREIRLPGADPEPGPSSTAEAGSVLELRYSVGEDGWKMLGECDADDIHAIADDYRRRATANQKLYRKFAALETLMRRMQIPTVAELVDRGVELDLGLAA